MKITYIHHSGYLVETDQALLLFDFVEGTLPALTPEKRSVRVREPPPRRSLQPKDL